MFSLLQSRRIRGNAGDPLPTVFQALDALGVQFRRGQLVLIAAGPGTGKSAFALTEAIGTGLPSMYFSADSDSFTQLVRAVCITTGWTMEEASKAVLEDTLGEKAEEELARLQLRLNYDASLSLDTIEETLMSWFEVYEDYPALIIVDNVTNVREGSEGEGGLDGLMTYLHDMARKTQACVIGLHHVTGPFNDSDKPIPQSGVKGQISGVPPMILTLFKPSEDTLGVSPVKNRGGKADPSGWTYAQLSFDGERMSIKDFPSQYGPNHNDVEVDSVRLDTATVEVRTGDWETLDTSHDLFHAEFDDPFGD